MTTDVTFAEASLRLCTSSARAMLCSRVLGSVLPAAGSKGGRRARRRPAAPPRAFHYDVQEMEDDEARRARESKEREAFKASAAAGKRLFPKGIDPKDYTIEQLAFLSRKEQGIMPDMNDCAICDGVGTLICTACHGTGMNPQSNADKFADEVKIFNDAMHGGMMESMLTQEGGICWICRGAKHIACTACEGSGKRDFAENYICD